MYQKLTVIGRVGQDPELRVLDNGRSVTNFSVAAGSPYNKDKTVWIRVAAWGKTAEIVNQYVNKGMLVMCEGELTANEQGSPRVFNTASGEARSSFEMSAERVLFLSRNEQTEAQSSFEGEISITEDTVPF